jgi:hypothetical protein
MWRALEANPLIVALRDLLPERLVTISARPTCPFGRSSVDRGKHRRDFPTSSESSFWNENFEGGSVFILEDASGWSLRRPIPRLLLRSLREGWRDV